MAKYKLVGGTSRKYLVVGNRSTIARAVNRYRKRGRRVRYVSKGMLNKAVSKIMDKRTETKQISGTYDNYFNSSIASTSEFYPLIPGVAQGYGDNQRIGQKIRMKFLKLKGVISYEITSGQTFFGPLYADIFILKDLIQRSQNIAPHDYKILNNSGIATAYNGDPLVAQYPLNTEEWKLIKRIRKRLALNWAPGNSSTGLTEPATRMQATFTLKIPVYNQQLDYESNTAVLPQNTNYWMCAGFFQYGGATQALTTPLRIQWVNTLYYKDD